MYKTIRKYSLIFGAGGVAALQAMKLGIFSFPESLRIYLGYFFSMITIVCVFLAGISIIETVKNTSQLVKKINSMEKEDNEDCEDEETN